MKKLILLFLIFSCIVNSCKKTTSTKDKSASTTSTTSTNTPSSTPTPTVEGELTKFLNLMTGKNALSWELVEAKDSLGNNLTNMGVGTKYVYSIVSSSIFPDSKKNPADTTKYIIDNDNGMVILKTYAFAPGSNSVHTGVWVTNVRLYNKVPYSLDHSGGFGDSWAVVKSTTSEFNLINNSGNAYMNKTTQKYVPSTMPSGFVPPAPTSTTSTLCCVGTWTKIACAVTSTQVITATSANSGNASLDDTDCAGTTARHVEWNWAESSGVITWTYTKYKIGGKDQTLPAKEVTPYTCSGNSFSSGGVTWTRFK